jgi:hypothetical protein
MTSAMAVNTLGSRNSSSNARARVEEEIGIAWSEFVIAFVSSSFCKNSEQKPQKLQDYLWPQTSFEQERAEEAEIGCDISLCSLRFLLFIF